MLRVQVDLRTAPEKGGVVSSPVGKRSAAVAWLRTGARRRRRQRVESRGVTATFLSAYRSISGESLLVAMEISTGEADAELFIYSASYRAPDGRQRQASDALGPFEIGAESTATVAAIFPAAEPGGTVTIEGIVDDDYSRTIELVIPLG